MSESVAVFSSKNWVDEKKKVSVTEKTITSGPVLHMHDYFEIEVITDGCGKQNLDGNTYELRRGSAYFLSPVEYHCVVPDGELKIINISFDTGAISSEMLNALLDRNENRVIYFSEEDTTRVEFLTEMFVNDCEVDDRFSGTLTKSFLEYLLVKLVRSVDSAPTSEPVSDASPIYKCMRYMYLHFSETPSLEVMARISGYSASYFSKQFHDVTGKKYIDFLTSLKLNHAKLLLSATRRSVIDISSSCGFTSLSNFNRTFKNSTGMSPAAYRAKNAG